MLLIVIRKMLSNRWMSICLLVGSVLVVAMVSSIPVYTSGVFQRMLTRDLENYQISTGVFPGAYHVKSSLISATSETYRAKAYNMFNDEITGKLAKEIGLPVLGNVQNLIFDNLVLKSETSENDRLNKISLRMETQSDFGEHVKMLYGRMFSKQKTDGMYEVIVSEKAMKDLGLVLNKTYTLEGFSEKGSVLLKIKVVGIFTLKDPQDAYWLFKGLPAYEKSVLMDYELCQEDFIRTNSPLFTEVQWYYAFDYHKITLNNSAALLQTYDSQERWFGKYRGALDFKIPAIPIIKDYAQREKQLKLTLWVLMVPILLMLSFYIFMVSQLIIKNEENEIAVIKSRGASVTQVFTMFLIESLLLGIAAFLLGPVLGLYLCTVLGASNGFLEFVQRTALPLALNNNAYLYSLFAVLLFMVTMLIPVFISSRISIVQYKQRRARGSKKPVWKRYFLDILILAVAGYGQYRYYNQQKILSITGIKGTELEIDPLLFLISTFFVLGLGLLLLRVFPYFIRFVFWLGKRIWPPMLYASFIQVGRSGGQEQFLMLFIILALSTGIFNANTARTINRNIEDRIRYEIGADIAVQPVWESNRQKGMGIPGVDVGSSAYTGPARYKEPDFTPYAKLSGVEAATKVFVRNNTQAICGNDAVNFVTVMGIIPDEFGKVAWFRPKLLPHHINEYLNLLVKAPKAFLVSRTFKDKYKLKVGDSIYVTWGEQGNIEGTIYAFIDYWPAFNPNAQKEGEIPPNIVVANLSYIQSKTVLEPYEVWLKKKPGVTDTQVNNDIIKKKLNIRNIEYANQRIKESKNDPLLQGTNGSLTLGFVVAMIICTIGFFIYWILSVQKRVLQFGILRAMGLNLKEVVGMIICEQVLISGTAVFLGIVIGSMTSRLFVPLLQLVYSSAEQVPPFKVIASAQDYVKIYMVIGAMLIIGFLVLGKIIARIRIDQAVKLGED